MEKQKYTNIFFSFILKYFQDFHTNYENVAKSLEKFDLRKKYKDQIIYAGLRNSIE